MSEHQMTLEQMKLEIEQGEALFLVEPLYDSKQNVLLGTQKVLKLKDIDKIKRLFPEKADKTFLVRSAVAHYIAKEKREKFAGFVIQTIKKDEYFRKFFREQREFILKHVGNLLPENDYLIWKLSQIRTFSNSLFLHTIRVTIFSLAVYFVYNHKYQSGMLDAEEIQKLMEAAFLHDVGYLKYDVKLTEIKIGQRTAEQQTDLEQHPIEGYKLIRQESKRHDLDEEVLNAVLDHEERMDGSGQPRGLGGDDFGILTRILMVTNYFELLLEEQWSVTKHLIKDYIRKLRSQKEAFDQNVGEALLEVFRVLFHQG